MLRIAEDCIAKLELMYPGITEQVMRFEAASLPACPYCGSADTGKVTVAYIGRLMNISACTTRCYLVPIGPIQGKYGCNACNKFFD